MMAGLWVEDDDLGFIGVSRTSSILGGSRTRLVLGGLSLGGDDQAWVDWAWVAAPMGTISPVLGCDPACVSGGAISLVLGVTRPCFWCDLLAVSLSLSLSSIFLGRNSFESKIQTEMVLQGQRAYFKVNGNGFPFDPIFLAHPNTRIYRKSFSEVI